MDTNQKKQAMNRAAVELMTAAKDAVRTALASAVTSKEVRADEAMVQRLTALAISSMDGAFYQAHPFFEKTVDSVLK